VLVSVCMTGVAIVSHVYTTLQQVYIDQPPLATTRLIVPSPLRFYVIMLELLVAILTIY
jgi:hypothetical protein